jgi:hypothetical protein
MKNLLFAAVLAASVSSPALSGMPSQSKQPHPSSLNPTAIPVRAMPTIIIGGRGAIPYRLSGPVRIMPAGVAGGRGAIKYQLPGPVHVMPVGVAGGRGAIKYRLRGSEISGLQLR